MTSTVSTTRPHLTSIKPVTFMLASTFNLSLSGLLSKNLSTVLSYELLMLLRFCAPAALMVWLLAITDWQRPTRSSIKPILFRSLFIALTQLCFLYAISHLSLMESVVLFSTGPLFIPLLEKIIFNTPIKGVTLVALVMAFVGVAIQSGIGANIDWRPELLIGVASGLFNASGQVCMYRAAKSELSSLALNTWCMLFASVLATGVFLLIKVDEIPAMLAGQFEITSMISTSALSSEGMLWVVLGVLLLSLTSINTQIFRAKAYRLVSSGAVLAPLIFTNLLFATLWQVMFFEFDWQPNKVMGMVLIISAVILNSMLQRKNHH